jgi:hypothetical protein
MALVVLEPERQKLVRTRQRWRREFAAAIALETA